MIFPTFIPVPDGTLYLAVYGPVGRSECRGWIVHVPAFAEEMNKARAMVSRQARLLAEKGYCVVIPDLYGTGDSSGDFGDADWTRWKNDIAAVVSWTGERAMGQPVCLWGLRLGCLLALEVARACPEKVRQLVLWQPVLAGKQFITQFLRLRMAAGLTQGKNESTAEIRALLDAGNSVEVAGYELAPALVSQLDEVSALSLLPPAGTAITWYEVAGQVGKPLSPVSRKVIDAWEESGVSVEHRVVKGEPFWTTQEIAFAPDLLDATHQCLDDAFRSAPNPPACPTSDFPTVPGNTLEPVVFDCEGDELVGILHKGEPLASRAVLLVVGGPQYRVGSHRQFVHLARDLADAGIPVLRFDYRGMGDSSGDLAGFEGISQDIASAIDVLQRTLPSVMQVVIWGLCDAASAASFYAGSDDRVSGLVLLNPWVRSEQGEARAYLKHYYRKRLFSSEFWKKLLGGDFDFFGSLSSIGNNLRQAMSGQAKPSLESSNAPVGGSEAGPRKQGLVDRVYHGLANCQCPALLIFSGQDLTAAEFLYAVSARRDFRKLLKSKRFERRDLADSDHTFSRRQWRHQVSQWTLSWMQSH